MFKCFYRDISCEEVGMTIKRRPSIPAPKRRVQTVKIAGRDGELVIDEGLYESIVIKVEFNFLTKSPDQWMDAFRKAKEWLSGHGNLCFSDDMDWFFDVNYVEITDTERTTRRLGNFTAEFHCDPYMYSRDGQNLISVDESGLYNPYMTAHPIYYITGTGSGTLTVNGKTVDFVSESIGVLTGMLTIDTDLMRTVHYSTPANNAISGLYEDLYLRNGMNYISISSGFTVEIVPRWRTR